MRFLAYLQNAYKLTNFVHPHKCNHGCVTNSLEQVCARLYGSKSSGNSKYFKSKKLGKNSKRRIDKYKYGSICKRKLSRSTSSITPIALISNFEHGHKFALIPVNLSQGKRDDEEAFQEALAISSLLRDNGRQIELFAENWTKNANLDIGVENVEEEAVKAADEETEAHLENNPTLTEFEVPERSNWINEQQMISDEIKPKGNDMMSNQQKEEEPLEVPFISFSTSAVGKEGTLKYQLPPKIEDELKKIPVSGMQLNFEMDMTNVKDALLNHHKLSKKPSNETKQGENLALSTDVNIGSSDAPTIPLQFNALINGTVNVNPKEFSKEKLNNLQVPEFNEHVTAIAANLCSTALQKGFPTDVCRKMYSTDDKVSNNDAVQSANEKSDPMAFSAEDILTLFRRYDQIKQDIDLVESSETNFEKSIGHPSEEILRVAATVSAGLKSKKGGGDKKKRSPHIVCVREGDKGCISPGLAGNPEYTPKGASSGGATQTRQEGSLGKLNLLSCKVYRDAIKEAAERRKALKKSSSNCCVKKTKKKPPAKTKCKPKNPCTKERDTSPKCGCKKADAKDPCKKKSQSKDPCKKKSESSKSGMQKGVDCCNKPSSTVKCAAKKSDGKDACKKSSKTLTCGSKKSSSSSKCGSKKADPCKKSSKTSTCGSTKSSGSKCGSKKSGGSKCGSKKADGKDPCKKSSTTSTCGAKKSSSSSKCGSKKADPCKKASKTSTCGSTKSSGSKCGSKKSGGSKCGSKKADGKDPCKKSSTTSTCGAKKSSSSSKCGSKKADPCKKASKTSTCGSTKSSGSKCGSKSGGSKCGSKSGGSKCGSKKADAKSPCKKQSSSSKCGSSGSKCGSSASKCGSKKSSAKDSCKKSSSTSKCGSSGSKCGSSASKCGSKKSSAKDPCKKASKCGSSGSKCGSSASKCGSKKSSASKCGSSASKCGSKKSSASKCGSSASKCGSKKSSGKDPCKKSSNSSCGSKGSKKRDACGNPPRGDIRPKCKNKSKPPGKCMSTDSSKTKGSKTVKCAKEGCPVCSSKNKLHTFAAFEYPIVIKSSSRALERSFSDGFSKKACKGSGTGKDIDYERRRSCEIGSWKDTNLHRKKRKPVPSKPCYEPINLCPNTACYKVYIKKHKENTPDNGTTLCKNKTTNTQSFCPFLKPQCFPVFQRCLSSAPVRVNEEALIAAPYKLCTRPRRVPKMMDNDVLLKVDSVALSDSDIFMFETGGTKYKTTLGNEAAAVVEKVGKSVTHLKVGDHVVIEAGIPCGNCDLCKTGRYNLCYKMLFNCCLRKYCAHPAAFCHKTCNCVPFEHAALVYQLASGFNACSRAKIKSNSSVVVIGSCATALCAAMCAKVMGAGQICLLSDKQQSEDIAKEFVTNKTQCYDSTMEDIIIAKNILESLGTRPDVVINCASCTKTMNAAIIALNPSGKCVLCGFYSECASFNLVDTLIKEINIIPSFRSRNMFPVAIALLETGRVPMDCLLATCCKWDHLEGAFRTALSEANNGPRKVVVNCNTTSDNPQKKEKEKIK